MAETEGLVVPNTKKNIRHAEKRRTSTCQFSDRVARMSIDQYHRLVPESERLAQTCLATIVAHSIHDGSLTVLSMGVGTKFMPEVELRHEARSSDYGRRVRDCHAEVLARRGFRRELTLEILQDLQRGSNEEEKKGILTRSTAKSCASFSKIQYVLRPGVTLHLYTSSAPCGNATLKKFAKMAKERFRGDMGPDEWLKEEHEPIHGSSLQLGQFALLLKRDNSLANDEDERYPHQSSESLQFLSKKEANWPANLSDDWAPPGTTIMTMPKKGSIHSCSDKICIWNYLGLQGSLLSSVLEEPLYLSTMTVGRKFTSCICRRAICCRMEDGTRRKSPTETEEPIYRLNHPAVMGTAVYMDEMGVVKTNTEVDGQDVRFHSCHSWCWWRSLSEETGRIDFPEGIDGSTGYLTNTNDLNEDCIKADQQSISRVCTASLTELFMRVYRLLQFEDPTTFSVQKHATLLDLLLMKALVAPQHEACKARLLTKHPVFRHWRRRSSIVDIPEDWGISIKAISKVSQDC